MKLIIAKTAGFCMGVDMALRKLDKAIETQSGTIYTLGPIIHNPQVLERYKNQGVLQTDGSRNLGTTDTVVIRAHGIPKILQRQLESQMVSLIDATCPKVKKAQILIQKQADQGKHLLLFGERNHPEVRGLVSYAPAHTIFESLDELLGQRLDSGTRYFLAAQTTQDRDSFAEICEHLHTNLDPGMVVLDTICTATKDRQDEVRNLSSQVEAMIVVGGKDSGNTRRLAQIAHESGIFTIHIETSAEIPWQEFSSFSRIGLTAGASTPAWIIRDVADTMRMRFMADVEGE